MWNRRFWHTLFTCNFQINQKAYLQTLKFLHIPPNISMTPIHTKKIITLTKHTHKTQTFPITSIYTKKIITLKKNTQKSENTYITPFCSNKFLKVTIFIKSIHTNPKYPYNLHSYKKIITLKSILTNLKIPGTIFLLISFSNI